LGGSRKIRAHNGGRLEAPLVAILLAALSAAAVYWFHQAGYLYYYGDSEAHLNIARRVVDSRTPGYEQLGSVWLPLLHVLMLPFVRHDALWQSGLAGSIPSAAAFVMGGAFLFAAVRRVFASSAPAWAAAALYALNPNVLYLQSTAMTEPLFLACLMALLYCTVTFRQTQSYAALLGAAAANVAASLTRYEGWFLIPFATLYIFLAARRNRVAAAALYGAVASLGALYWLAHNQYFYSDFLYFYRGPYSARAIQGNRPYPGMGDWSQALLYFRTAARLCVGAPLFWIGLAGVAAAAWRRAFWPLALAALPAAFYVMSIHSSGTPIFVPELWPNSYYNTRYGLAMLPLAALGAAALVSLAPPARRRWAALAIVLASVSPWLLQPRPEAWITWKESQVNSEGRREWTRQAADYLGARYRPGAGIYTGFGDLTGIYRAMPLPLKRTLTGDNNPHFMAAFSRPDLFLNEEWAVCMGGDPVQTVLTRARRPHPGYPRYTLVKSIVVKGAPVIEIWRRFTPAEEP
jgi:hypothetical protein